jgi:hypothetical protein
MGAFRLLQFLAVAGPELLEATHRVPIPGTELVGGGNG